MAITGSVVHKSVEMRHGKTRYLDVGTGHPLLLPHLSSIESGADDWLRTLDILSSEFRVLAPDVYYSAAAGDLGNAHEKLLRMEAQAFTLAIA